MADSFHATIETILVLLLIVFAVVLITQLSMEGIANCLSARHCEPFHSCRFEPRNSYYFTSDLDPVIITSPDLEATALCGRAV